MIDHHSDDGGYWVILFTLLVNLTTNHDIGEQGLGITLRGGVSGASWRVGIVMYESTHLAFSLAVGRT